jgi:hypothetical protein
MSFCLKIRTVALGVAMVAATGVTAAGNTTDTMASSAGLPTVSASISQLNTKVKRSSAQAEDSPTARSKGYHLIALGSVLMMLIATRRLRRDL